MKKLTLRFFAGKDVVRIAKELLGKVIKANIDGVETSARIVETEAYIGLSDRASHSFNGRRTARNEHMYWPAATVYVYICYGLHRMLNVVTNDKEIPDAVLIRAVEPLTGMYAMEERTGKRMGDHSITKGPGNVCKALGIEKHHSGESYLGNIVSIWDDEFLLPEQDVGISRRIGIEGAGEEALVKPYRFYLRKNKYVSGSPRT